jgi:biopolymer transport protein ExbD
MAAVKFAEREMPSAEMDMTPMIDMTFQLIAFFMMLINFAKAEQDKRILLPVSALAIPAEDTEDQNFITLHVDDKDEKIIISAEEYTLDQLGSVLARKVAHLERDKLDRSKTRVILRADKNAPTGLVQKVIAKCQEVKLENFKLRAEQDRNK